MMGRAYGKGASSKRGLNRKLSRAKFGTIHRTFVTVFENHGGLALSLPYGYSSQTCSKCNYVHEENRDEKEFECLNCGHKNDSDVNAARNMSQRGDVYIQSRNNGSTNGVAIKAVKAYISKTRGKDRYEASREPRDLNTDESLVKEMCKGEDNRESSRVYPRGYIHLMSRRNRIRSHNLMIRRRRLGRLKLYRSRRAAV